MKNKIFKRCFITFFGFAVCIAFLFQYNLVFNNRPVSANENSYVYLRWEYNPQIDVNYVICSFELSLENPNITYVVMSYDINASAQHKYSSGNWVNISYNYFYITMNNSSSPYIQYVCTTPNGVNFMTRDGWSGSKVYFRIPYNEYLYELYNNGLTSLINSAYNDGYTAGYTAGETIGYTDGYTAGEEYGQENGYLAGLNDGYVNGWDEGYPIGYDEGINYNVAQMSFLGWINTAFQGVDNVLKLEIFPNIRLWYIVAVPVLLLVVRLFLKLLG